MSASNNILVLGQFHLQNKFQNSQDYMENPVMKKKFRCMYLFI